MIFAMSRFLALETKQKVLRRESAVAGARRRNHPHIYLNMGDASEIVCPYCSTLFCFDPTLVGREANPVDCAWN